MASHPVRPGQRPITECTRTVLCPSAPPENRKQTKGAWKFHVQPSSSPREGRKVIFIAWDLNHLTDCCCLCSPPQFYDGNHQVIRRSLESAEIMSLVAVKALVCNRTCTARTIWDQTKDQPSLYIHFMEFSLKIRGKNFQSHQYDSLYVCRSQQTDVTNCVWNLNILTVFIMITRQQSPPHTTGSLSLSLSLCLSLSLGLSLSCKNDYGKIKYHSWLH